MGDVVAEESSHPFQASFHPCFPAAPCHRTWLEELPLLKAAQDREACRSEVSTTEGGRRTVVAQLNGKALASPKDLCSNLLARPASWRFSRFEGLFSSLSLGVSPFLFAFCVLWRPHTASASLHCPCHAEMDVDREMRRMTCFLHLHPLFLKLKADVPCNSPTRFTTPCPHATAAIS